MEMLQQEYGSIIIKGLCNSYEFLDSYFRRECKKLMTEEYEPEELIFNFREVFNLMRSSIDKVYQKQLKSFKEYSDLDRTLSPTQKYNYPKPNEKNIPLLMVQYPSGYKHDLTSLNKQFFLSDLDRAENALLAVIGNPNAQDPTAKIVDEELNALDRNGCEAIFQTKNDYESFRSILIAFFKGDKYLLKSNINLRRATKTKVARAMNDIYNKLGQHTLVSDKKFLLIVKKLNHFSDLTTDQIYNALTK